MSDHGKPHREALIASRRESQMPTKAAQSGVHIIIGLIILLGVYGWASERDTMIATTIQVAK